MNIFKKFRKFKKNAKALSPVIASIILIAVTVAVSVVVAAWMGALTLGFMGNAEQASIVNVSFVNVGTVDAPLLAMNATVINTGTNSITISSATIDGNSAALTATGSLATAGTGNTPSFVIAKSDTGCFIITPIGSATFQDGAQYTLNLVTAKGHTLVDTATFSPSPSL